MSYPWRLGLEDFGCPLLTQTQLQPYWVGVEKPVQNAEPVGEAVIARVPGTGFHICFFGIAIVLVSYHARRKRIGRYQTAAACFSDKETILQSLGYTGPSTYPIFSSPSHLSSLQPESFLKADAILALTPYLQY